MREEALWQTAIKVKGGSFFTVRLYKDDTWRCGCGLSDCSHVKRAKKRAEAVL
jgi:hypothetical protein